MRGKSPFAFPLPDWNHWLPHVHPMDVWGPHFDKSEFAEMYNAGGYRNLKSAEDLQRFFAKWVKARNGAMSPQLATGSKRWTAKLAQEFYSAELWQLVKTWEMTQELALEKRGARIWLNVMAVETAPASANIPDGVSGMGGSALTNEFFNSAWYALQMVVNSSSHRRHGREPFDWPYILGRYLSLEKVSGRPEPGRLLIALIQGMQANDARIGPENLAQGWRPEEGIDPRILVEPEWAPMFSTLSETTRRETTQALLKAWLDKTTSYPTGAYFQLGLTVSSYRKSTVLGGLSGGRVWDAAEQFRKAGVDSQTLVQLREFGQEYMSLAGLFHY